MKSLFIGLILAISSMQAFAASPQKYAYMIINEETQKFPIKSVSQSQSTISFEANHWVTSIEKNHSIRINLLKQFQIKGISESMKQDLISALQLPEVTVRISGVNPKEGSYILESSQVLIEIEGNKMSLEEFTQKYSSTLLYKMRLVHNLRERIRGLEETRQVNGLPYVELASLEMSIAQNKFDLAVQEQLIKMLKPSSEPTTSSQPEARAAGAID